MSKTTNSKSDDATCLSRILNDTRDTLAAMKPHDWRPHLSPMFLPKDLKSIEGSVGESVVDNIKTMQRRYLHLVKEKVVGGNVEGLGMDTPIYRTMTCKNFRRMLKSGKLYLANPLTWAEKFDQWEKSLLSGGVFIKPTHSGECATPVTVEIKDALMDWYAQSWSLTDECEAIWSRYAGKRQRAVRIATTPRKLLLAMAIDEKLMDAMCLRRVEYLSEVEIESKKVISCPMRKEETLRELLCLKRRAFDYENEVRLLFIDRTTANSKCRGQALKFPLKGKLDFSSFIESVCLDPDASEECAKAEGQFMRQFGLSDGVQISTLKQPSLGATVVVIDNRC